MRAEDHREDRRPEFRVERQDPVDRCEAGGISKEEEADGAGPAQGRRDADGKAARRPERIGGSGVPDYEIDRAAENEKPGVEIPPVAVARGRPGIDRAERSEERRVGKE